MDTDIRTRGLKQPVNVAEYLLTRLHQIGVRSVHGVPGDYNLAALDYLPKAGLQWVGSVNELNAGALFPKSLPPSAQTPTSKAIIITNSKKKKKPLVKRTRPMDTPE